MAGSDGNGQRIHACAGYKLFYLIRLRISCICSRYIDSILDTSQSSKLCLYNDTSLMRILHDFLGQFDVGLEVMMRTIDHNGSKSAVDTGLADLEISTMVQMKSDRKVRSLHQHSLN